MSTEQPDPCWYPALTPSYCQPPHDMMVLHGPRAYSRSCSWLHTDLSAGRRRVLLSRNSAATLISCPAVGTEQYQTSSHSGISGPCWLHPWALRTHGTISGGLGGDRPPADRGPLGTGCAPGAHVLRTVCLQRANSPSLDRMYWSHPDSVLDSQSRHAVQL